MNYEAELEAILKRKYKNKLCGVYQITCSVNGNVYIGSTNNIERRVATHLLALTHKRHANYKLQADFNSFGADAFVFSNVIELTKTPSRDHLYDLKQKSIDEIKPQYNIQLTVKRIKYDNNGKPLKTAKRLAEGVTGRDLKGFKRKSHKNKGKKNKFKQKEDYLKNIIDGRASKKKFKSKRKWPSSALKDLNIKNDLVNKRRRELEAERLKS